jgi:hypothetical protein
MKLTIAAVLIMTVCFTGHVYAKDLYNSSYKKLVFQENGVQSFSGAYPEFIGLKISASKLRELNSNVSQFARELLSRFLSEDDIGKGIKQDLKSSTKGSSFNIEFKDIRVGAKYVSVRFETYFMQEGAPHGVLHRYGFNYDVERSKIIYLKDLFLPGEDYLEQINKFCNHDFEKQVGKGFYEKNSVVDKSQFVLSRQSLTILFSAYEIASYSAGAPEVEIPFTKLKGFKK